MATMPSLIALSISPARKQPDLGWIALRMHDLHAEETRRIIDPMRALAEGCLNLGRHVIGDGEPTQDNNHVSPTAAVVARDSHFGEVSCAIAGATGWRSSSKGLAVMASRR